MFIQKAIQEYTPNLDPNDKFSLDHGTAVSAFALYGDITEIIEISKKFEPVGKLFFASQKAYD